jgi:aryl-alcohol dehydrogenase-like predicted oxidoreductase
MQRMERRQLGRQGLAVSRVGLGCMGMSDFYGPNDEGESIATIHRALELGVCFFDTADMYGRGANEELLGRALAGRREEAIVATKFGIVRGEGDERRVDGTPDYVRRACEASLVRLGIDTIDLYYQHRVDPDTPIEETVGAMSELVTEGKVRFLGLSEAAPETLRRAFEVHPISALQTELSLWSREPLTMSIPVCRELGVGFVSYSPLGRGFLTGRFRSGADFGEDDFRRSQPRMKGDNLEANLALVDRVQEIAAEKGVTPAQLALAWVLAAGEDVVPIPGTTKQVRLEENVEAVSVSLGADELARLDELGDPVGDRYADMSSVDA